MFSSLERRSADGRLPGLLRGRPAEPAAAVGRGAMSCGVWREKYAGRGPEERGEQMPKQTDSAKIDYRLAADNRLEAR